MKNKSIAIFAIYCACALALGLVGCSGGSSSGNTTSGTADAPNSTSSAADTSAGTSSTSTETSGDMVATDYVDAHGHLTLKALVELDGNELVQEAQNAGYEWNDTSCIWKKDGSSVWPTRALTQEEYDAGSGLDAFNFALDEVAAFDAGSVGTPVLWTVSDNKTQYSSADEMLASQQLDITEQCEVENSSYGIETWALVQSSAGERYLLEVRYDGDEPSGTMLLYTADYVATETTGIASAFLFVPDGLYEAHTIDDAWTVLKAAAQA